MDFERRLKPQRPSESFHPEQSEKRVSQVERFDEEVIHLDLTMRVRDEDPVEQIERLRRELPFYTENREDLYLQGSEAQATSEEQPLEQGAEENLSGNTEKPEKKERVSTVPVVEFTGQSLRIDNLPRDEGAKIERARVRKGLPFASQESRYPRLIRRHNEDNEEE